MAAPVCQCGPRLSAGLPVSWRLVFMNSQRFSPLLGFFVVCASLIVIASVLLGNGNQFSMLFRYVLILGFVSGLLLPRPALIFWLVLCAYTDLLKRLMIVSGRVEMSDLYSVLGLPPVMLFGITFSVLMGGLSGRQPLKSIHWRLFATSCLLTLVGAVFAIREKGGSVSASVAAIANFGSYTLLIFVVPALFKDSRDVLKLAKVLLWTYLPVAAYGMFQQFHGFQDFELEYLKSGLTIEIKQLYAHEVRPFSTLNSPTALSVVCAFLAVMSLMLTYIPQRDGRGMLLGSKAAATFAAIYLAGMVASTSRSSVVLVIIALVGFIGFRSRRGTQGLYVGLVASFIALVLMANTILLNLDGLQAHISEATGDGQLATQLSRVGTFSDRLQGFQNLATNPQAYTLFGYGGARGSKKDDDFYSHDIISNILVKHGVVALLAIMLVGGLMLVRLHRRVWCIQDRHHRLLAAAFLSLAFSFFPLSAVSGNVIGVFPVNTLLWLCFGMLIVICQSDTRLDADGPLPAADTDGVSVAKGPRVTYRFRQSGTIAQVGDHPSSPG
jgi:hypothetical protein